MQIIIPMSGFGERFRRVGYKVPKPLIEVEGKPIIAHVVDMFPDESDFIFICNADHLSSDAYNMRSILLELCPSAEIIGISAHKLGPVHAVLQVEELIKKDQPVIVNYCDFTCYWDWPNFKDFVRSTECAGAIPAYKGFHPHSLGSTNYAYVKEDSGWISGIQEKQPYTENRMEEYASSGTYYFKSGRIMLDAFHKVVEADLNLNGEYYVSLAYDILIQANKNIAAYPLQHFMQWGTPEDVDEYNSWSQAFKSLVETKTITPSSGGSLVIPMAGLGQRFSAEGYTDTKPLIGVSGKPMVIQAVNSLPAADQYAFVLREDMSGHAEISAVIKKEYPGAIVKLIPDVTEGQAITALIAAKQLELDGSSQSLITVGACDFGSLYDKSALQLLQNNPDVDVIVWGVRGYPSAVRKPKMFGWIDEKDGVISNISVKTPLDSPETDAVVLGTFSFRKIGDLEAAISSLVARDGRVNGEFYLDSCINDAISLGLKCHLFEVDSFLCWGTPDDLKTFEYWQSCFHKWDGHSYSLDLDPMVEPSNLSALVERYAKITPTIPS